MRNLGKRIFEARQALGWSQADLAAKAGVTQGTIGHLESGRSRSSTKMEVLRMSADQLEFVEASIVMARLLLAIAAGGRSSD